MPVLTEIDGRGVATVTLDRAAKLNALDSAMARGLVEAIEKLALAESLRAVVLRGAGERAFIGGADVNELAALDATTARAFITGIHAACDALRRLPVPVIARLQGHVLGAGLEIAVACDLRIAGDGARFGMPEVRIGIPSVVEAALLPMLIGWGRTRWLVLTGEPIDMARALAWGLVEEVAPAGELDAAIERVVEAILASGPHAVRLQKQLVTAWEDLPLRAAVQRGIEVFADSFRTDEPARMMARLQEEMRRREDMAAR